MKSFTINLQPLASCSFVLTCHKVSEPCGKKSIVCTTFQTWCTRAQDDEKLVSVSSIKINVSSRARASYCAVWTWIWFFAKGLCLEFSSTLQFDILRLYVDIWRKSALYKVAILTLVPHTYILKFRKSKDLWIGKGD